MAFPTFPTTEATLVQQYNGNTYNATTNEYGMAGGGHRQNWVPAMLALGVLSQYVGAVVTEIDLVAAQVSTDAASAAAGSGTEATLADIRSGTSAHYLSVRNVYSANAPIDLTDSTSIAWDMAAGVNFKVTLGAADRAVANPTNQIAGKSGFLIVAQDATGARTITTWGSAFIWIGSQPSWASAANAVSLVSYFVEADGRILLSFAGSSS